MEQKNNSGSLYKNKKDKTTQPDYGGTALIDGKKYRLAGWINKSKSGGNYLRILITEIIEQDLNAAPGQGSMPMPPMANQGPADSVILDDLPF